MKKVLFSLLIIVSMLFITACGQVMYKMDGKEILFDQKYKDTYISYNFPSVFKDVSDTSVTYNPVHTYEYYNGDKLSFVLTVEEHSLGLSFSAMEEDAKKVETNTEHKNVQREVIKNNGKNLVRYSFNKSDEFGEDTLYYVYYGGYSYAGINEYIKIIFTNVSGREDFEKAFLSGFKINK